MLMDIIHGKVSCQRRRAGAETGRCCPCLLSLAAGDLLGDGYVSQAFLSANTMLLESHLIVQRQLEHCISSITVFAARSDNTIYDML